MIDYLEAFQSVLSPSVIMALGVVASLAKLFEADEGIGMIKMFLLMPLSGLLFNRISQMELTWNEWKPFAVGLLVQIAIHIILASVLFAIPGRSVHRFTKYALAIAPTSFFYYGCAVVQFAFDETQMIIPVLMGLAQHVLVTPLHTYLVLHEVETGEVFVDEGSDEIELDNVGDKKREKEEEGNSDEDKMGTLRESQPRVRKSDRLQVLWAVINPATLCAVFGVIWATFPWELPLLISSVSSHLGDTTMAGLIFIVGIVIKYHPFCGGNPVSAAVMVIFHCIMNPLIALLFCKLLNVSKEATQVCVLCQAMPVDAPVYLLMLKSGFKGCAPAVAFFWTHIINLPVLVIWITIFNETDLLG